MGLPALSTGLLVAIGLFVLLLVPYLLWEIRRGKAKGHTWFTWWKPAGHSDIGPDTGPRPTAPGGIDGAAGRALLEAEATSGSVFHWPVCTREHRRVALVGRARLPRSATGRPGRRTPAKVR